MTTLNFRSHGQINRQQRRSGFNNGVAPNHSILPVDAAEPESYELSFQVGSIPGTGSASGNATDSLRDSNWDKA
jgi:hypothetical protein